MTEAIRNQDELIHLLNSLIALDYDAIEAYDAAVERLQGTDKQQLAAFAADHRRHISALTPAVSSRGGVPAQHADFKRILTKGKVVFGGLMGDKQVLEAMKSNEDTTNKKYEEALAEVGLPLDVREVFERNLADERRHRAWLEARLMRMTGAAAPPPSQPHVGR
jgi:uncharacterized protein (TIGR02284 family)